MGSNWVVGVDPDVSGALALLKIDESGCSAQVIPFFFDDPFWFLTQNVALKKFGEYIF